MTGWVRGALIGVLQVCRLVRPLAPRLSLPQQARVLAGNQGLYHGFLAAGLFWSLTRGLSGEGIGSRCSFGFACWWRGYRAL